MKKTKIIIPAMGLLLLSTAASVTGTVAWFSTNSTVSATGMQINAQTDSNFLIIHEINATYTAFNGSLASTSVTSSATAQSLLPCAPATTLTKDNIDLKASWHYAYSTNPNDADEGVTAESYQPIPQLSGYVAIDTFAVGLTASSAQNSSAGNLRLKEVTLPEGKGISCVVRIDDATTNGCTVVTPDEPLTAPADLGIKASKNGTIIKVYYFINGEDANVYSNNAVNLTGQISLVFDVNGTGA